MASAASTLSLESYILSDCAPSDSSCLQSYLLSWWAQFGDVPVDLPSLNSPFAFGIGSQRLCLYTSTALVSEFAHKTTGVVALLLRCLHMQSYGARRAGVHVDMK